MTHAMAQTWNDGVTNLKFTPHGQTFGEEIKWYVGNVAGHSASMFCHGD